MKNAQASSPSQMAEFLSASQQIQFIGLSLPQLTRLIRQYRRTGQIEALAYRRHRFPRRLTDADVALLAGGTKRTSG